MFGAVVVLVGISPILFQSASVTLEQLQSGYDPVRQAMSSLVFGNYGWIQTAAFYLLGISLIVLAVILYFHLKIKFKVGIVAVALLGTAFTIVGGNTAALPGSAPTVSTFVHNGASIFIAALFPIACFLLAPSLKAKGHTVLRRYTIGVGISSLLFFTIGGSILVLHLSMIGIFERIMLWNGLLWIELVCAQLLLDRLRNKSQPHLTE